MENTQPSQRVCYLCNVRKPIEEFIQRVDHRYYRMCKSCVVVLQSKCKKSGPKLLHTEIARTCYLCLRFLPVSEFTRRKTGTYYSACKACNKHVFAHRRRARKKNAEGSYTLAEWQKLLAQYDACPMCKRKWETIEPPQNRESVITVDHKIPLSKGGSNAIENIQPLCYSCNSIKGDRIVKLEALHL